jgi:hypothetical protein
MCHIMQGFKSGQFRAYDYGRTQNMKLYGQLTPPPYDFKNVKIPVATFTSSHDNLVPAQVIKSFHGIYLQINILLILISVDFISCFRT